MIKKLFLMAFLVGFLFLVGLRVYEQLAPGEAVAGAAAGRGDPGGGRGGPSLLVEKIHPEYRTFQDTLEVLGELKARASVEVMSRLNGRLRQVLWDRGDFVRQGELIAVVDDDELRQQIRRAEAAVEVARAGQAREQATRDNLKLQLERYRELHEEALISTQDFQDAESRVRIAQSQLALAEAQVEQAEASLEELKIRLEYTRIYAPLGGYIGMRRSQHGRGLPRGAETMKRVGVTQQELRRARALAEQLREEQTRNVEALGEQIAQKANAEKVSILERESGEKFAGVDREITTVKDEVKSTKQELTDTRAQLAAMGVKVDEQGKLIATNSTGLEELRRRGERDYVTFDLTKKQKTRVAGIILELRDTDLGKNPDADLRIYANDTRMERKDLPLNTPVNFYVGADRIAYELVVNEVFKNRCTGYLSVPKGKLPQGPPALSMLGP